MKRIIQISLMLCVCFLHLIAQTATEDMPEPNKNSIYIEGGGSGITYSINYDHLFSLKNKPKMGIGGRIGYSHGSNWWLLGMESIVAILPVESFFSYGVKSCLELGLGYTFVFEEDNREDEITLRSSYKYRGPKGFIFGVGVLARMDSNGILFPIPHLSIGFSF